MALEGGCGGADEDRAGAKCPTGWQSHSGLSPIIQMGRARNGAAERRLEDPGMWLLRADQT
jgi:hypothetical protein